VQTNFIAQQFKDRHAAGLPYENAFDQILQAFDWMILLHAKQIMHIHGDSMSFEDACGEVMTRMFELTIEYDPNYENAAAFGGYLKKKLTSWTTWEAMKRGRGDRHGMTYMPPDVIVNIVDEHVEANNELMPDGEARKRVANCSEATADMLFLRHVVGMTQSELGEVYDCHQQTVSAHLKSARALLREEALT